MSMCLSIVSQTCPRINGKLTGKKTSNVVRNQILMISFQSEENLQNHIPCCTQSSFQACHWQPIVWITICEIMIYTMLVIPVHFTSICCLFIFVPENHGFEMQFLFPFSFAEETHVRYMLSQNLLTENGMNRNAPIILC